MEAFHDAKTITARFPVLALPAARIRGHGIVLDRWTEIVVEGFPRSGNTFAVAALRHAQDRAVRIAHHTHAPAHVIAAVRRGIPALVLARSPDDAVLEYVIRKPSLSLRQALRGYVRFYRPLLPYRGGFVVGLFSAVTTDFGQVIRRLNERFGTTFREFEHTDDNVQACFEAIDADYRARFGSGPEFQAVVARPSLLRDAVKDRMRPRLEEASLQRLRERAHRIFEVFAQLAGEGP
jgi:hypothetical protein